MAAKKQPAKPAGPKAVKGAKGPKTRNWYAWIDAEPPGPKRLHVTGEVQVGNPCVSATLTGHIPPGFNPTIFLMDLHLIQSPNPCIQVVTWVPVNYYRALHPTEPTYTYVDILYQGNSIARVKVEYIS